MGSAGSNPARRVKDICTAKYTKYQIFLILQVYKLVLMRSFRSHQKKPQKYVLFVSRKAGLMAPVAMHFAVF